MASAYLSDIQALNNNQHGSSAAADGALSVFEKGMFASPARGKAQEQSNEVDPDSLSYLFSIFAY